MQSEVRPGLGALLKLAWPIVISRSTQVVVGLCDALMVAHLGETALAATTTGAMNAFTLMILPMGTCFIVASFAAQLTGKDDREGARRYGFYGVGVAVATQLLCMLGISFVPMVLAQLDYTPELRAQMTGYLTLRLMSGGAMIGLEALGSYYGGIGNTVKPMLANVAAMVLNVVFCWIFIYGRLGSPAMGVRGSALAATLATWVAFLGLLVVFLRDRQGKLIPELRWQEIKRMLRFGLPTGLNWFFEFFAFMFFTNVVVAGLGVTSLAAMMSVLQINTVAFMPAFALASAGSIIAGQRIGAGDKDAVPGVLWVTFRSAAAWQGVVGAVYLLIPGLVFSAFSHGNQELQAAGTRLLMLAAAWQLVDAAVNTIAETLRAAGDTSWPLYARLAVSWLLFVPGSYLTVRHWGGGVGAAVAWIVGYLALLSVILWWRFRSGAWRHVQLVEPTVD